ELDSDRFRVRDKATQELAGLGKLAEPALRQALKSSPSPEVRSRIEALLKGLKESTIAPRLLRDLRTLDVLEQVGTPEARKVVEAMARGARDPRLLEEAKATLERLSR